MLQIMNFLTSILAETANGGGNGGGTGNGGSFWDNWPLFLLIGGVLIFLVFNMVSGRKRNKQRAELLNNIGIGTKIMTVGGMYGEVTGITPDNKLIVNVGSPENETLIIFDRQSIRNVVSGYTAPAVATPVAPVTAAPETVADPVVSEPFVAEVQQEEAVPVVDLAESVIEADATAATDEVAREQVTASGMEKPKLSPKAATSGKANSKK